MEQVEQLRAERNQLTAVLGGMVEGVVAIDLDRHVLHLNAVAAKWFRRPAPESAVGRPIYELSRQPEISGALIEAMERRRQVSRTFTLARFAGQVDGPNRFELNASPLLSSRRDDEVVEGAVAVIHDITELERLESVRRDFVSNVSHELKTPLTAIHGYVETLLEADPIDGPTRGRFLRKIRRQSNRLGALVSDLLTLSRIESAAEPPATILDLRSPAGEVLNLLGPAGEERGLELVADFPQAAVEVLGEEEAIRQALSNLVDNAVKYSSSGGRVLVRLQTENGRAVLECRRRGTGHRRRTSGPDLRTLLPCRPGPFQGARRHRPRPGDRQERRQTARWRSRGGKRTGAGLDVPFLVALRRLMRASRALHMVARHSPRFRFPGRLGLAT